MMKKYSWITLLTVSAMALAFTACTITTSDPEDGGVGGKAGEGGSAGAGGEQTGGAAGEQTGGAAGEQTGGAAGEQTGGSAGTGGEGPQTKTCKEKYPKFEGIDATTCHTCLVDKCCTQIEACINLEKASTESKSCEEQLDCVYNKCTDPGTFQDCANECADEGEFGIIFNEAASCLEPQDGVCGQDCEKTPSET